MLVFAVIVAAIIAIVGIIRLRNADPVRAMDKNARKAWADKNRDMWANKNNPDNNDVIIHDAFDLSFSLDPAGEDD